MTVKELFEAINGVVSKDELGAYLKENKLKGNEFIKKSTIFIDFNELKAKMEEGNEAAKKLFFAIGTVDKIIPPSINLNEPLENLEDFIKKIEAYVDDDDDSNHIAVQLKKGKLDLYAVSNDVYNNEYKFKVNSKKEIPLELKQSGLNYEIRNKGDKTSTFIRLSEITDDNLKGRLIKYGFDRWGGQEVEKEEECWIATDYPKFEDVYLVNGNDKDCVDCPTDYEKA